MTMEISDPDKLDAGDPFTPKRELFDLPITKNGETAIYLNGNSLGPKPKGFNDRLISECDVWAQHGVRAQLHTQKPWLHYSSLVSDSLAKLTGSKSQEVVATGTLSANLHFCFVTFYQPTPNRYKVIRLKGFPSDTYAIDSQVKQRISTLENFSVTPGYTPEQAVIEIVPDENGYIAMDIFKSVLEEHGEQACILWVEAIHYQTGQFFKLKELAKLAHAKGCKIGVDLAHAIGNVQLELHDWEIDFAVWCNYKYLSGSPGTIGGLYVHENYLSAHEITKLTGWWGHNKQTRFSMPNEFDPMPTVESWTVSNPSVLLIAGLQQSLSIFDDVDFPQLVEKNKRLVAYLESLLAEHLSNYITIITPKDSEERGCQLSLRIKNTSQVHEIEEALWEQGVICDVRGDLIRVAPVGLYTTFAEVHAFVSKLKLICEKYS